jgi:hypothetical protein
VENASDLHGMSSAENYSLAADIDLTELPGDWVGPTDYSGKFYGNGYTVKLILSQKKGQVGLFSKLTGGAGVYDLTVDVESPPEGLKMIGGSHFGGVVGLVDNILSASQILLKNVKVKGELVYSSSSSGGTLVVGGFIGEVNPANLSPIVFQNCVSELNITENLTNANSNIFGGFIGRGDSDITFTNCYAVGNISSSVSNSSMEYSVGGFMGSSLTFTSVVKMDNCYSAGTVSGTMTSPTQPLKIGGFVGYFGSTQAAAHIQNCVALNPGVAATSTGTVNIGRIMGDGEEDRLSGGNFALSSMAVTTNNVPVDVAGGTETNKNGLGKTAPELSDKDFWISKGFSETVWDFTGLNIAGKVYPKLR